MKRAKTNRSGQSLIEILVAVSILLIGVFAVLRLFPPGFKMLFQTGNAGQVGALTNDAAQIARNSQLQAADGVVERAPLPSLGVSPSGITGWCIPAVSLNGLPPALVATEAPSVPPDSVKNNQFAENSLFTTRTVMGERIPLKASGGAALLTLGPIYFPDANPGLNEINLFLQVYDPHPLIALGGPAPEFTAPGQFWVDSSSQIHFDPRDPDFNSDRHYLLSYRIIGTGNVPIDVVDEEIEAVPGQTVSFSGSAFRQGGTLLPASIQMFRDYPAGDGTNGTFRLIDPFAGVIQIQPYQVSYVDPTDPSGTTQYASIIAPGGVVAADYTTRDWQILREERDVPDDGIIHLPVTNLDILDRFTDPTTRVLVVDLDDPTKQQRLSLVTVPGTAPAPPSVNVRDGIVYLDPTQWAGRPVRVYYAAFNTWAAQPIVSYRSYALSPSGPIYGLPGTPFAGQPGYRYYSLDFLNLNTGNDNAPKVVFLHFIVADIGKVVSVDYHFVDTYGRVHYVYGQSSRIQASGPGSPSDATVALQYDGPYGADTGSGLPNGNVGIDRVGGISFQARGLYLESGDVRRADDPSFLNLIPPAESTQGNIWQARQLGRLGETTEDVYVAR